MVWKPTPRTLVYKRLRILGFTVKESVYLMELIETVTQRPRTIIPNTRRGTRPVEIPPEFAERAAREARKS